MKRDSINRKLFFGGLISIFLFTNRGTQVGAENFEFPLTHPMLITSLRVFDKMSDTFHISRPKNGSIILRAPPGHGIMAVVQEMNLQEIRHDSSLSSTPTCLDSITLSQVEGTGASSNQICGHVETGGHPPSFMDPSGFLELDFVLTEKTRISALDTPITNFNLSFTPFVECPEDAFPFGNGVLRPCSMLDTFSCISEDFFCDGVVNCAFPHEVGLDEINCHGPEVAPEETQDVQVDDVGIADDVPQTFEEVKPRDVDVVDLEQLENQLRIRIFHYGRQANAGIFATLTIFIILLGLIKMRSRREEGGSGRSRLFTLVGNTDPLRTGMEANDKSGGMGGVESIYDPEGDPVPSYEDCLLLDNHHLDMDNYPAPRPVYSALSLSIEHERPPSYEEVRVHSWTQKLRI